jgi:hypothetical protein
MGARAENRHGIGLMVVTGSAAQSSTAMPPLIFDGDRFTDFLNTTFADWLSRPLAYRPWAYPPSLLLMLLPFAHWVSSAPMRRFRW